LIEKDIELIKEISKIFISYINHQKIDLLVIELLKIKVLGLPYKSTKRHTVSIQKITYDSCFSLCRILSDNLDCPIEDAKKLDLPNNDLSSMIDDNMNELFL
ncbi:40766_t:CDS:2, partial [Gigaspora margarita]